MDFVLGDATGLRIPAHLDALREVGADFLTEAFQVFGSLPADNSVARIARIVPCPGGSTGQKVFLTVEYARPDPGLHTELFVKFSRDFSDEIRDRGKYELESEVKFAAISRLPGFPIRIPTAYFADYHQASMTGMLITERVAFGEGGIEPHRQKCLDHEIEAPILYYRAIIKALARLAAAHKAGRLPADIAERFPFDPIEAAAADPIPYDEAKLRRLVADYAAFAAAHPQLLPAGIREPDFIARLDREVGRFLAEEGRIKRFLQSDPDLIALCHWNAHIDNAWFWQDGSGALQCGLMDWGRVRPLNLAFALWGSLSGAPLEIWEQHLDELLDLFTDELAAGGGPRLDPVTLRLHLDLYVAMMGLAWMLPAPKRILLRLPEAAVAGGPHDPVFRTSETARNQLHIFTLVLSLWRAHDFAASLDRMLERAPRGLPS
jgi:hypothetical protein